MTSPCTEKEMVVGEEGWQVLDGLQVLDDWQVVDDLQVLDDLLAGSG